jgi:hypothetical protein
MTDFAFPVPMPENFDSVHLQVTGPLDPVFAHFRVLFWRNSYSDTFLVDTRPM